MSLPTDPATGLPYIIDDSGEKRLLAMIGVNYLKRAAFPPFEKAAPSMPESEWKEIDRRQTLPWILDQKNHGSCVGFSAATALGRARVVAGQPWVALSGALIYSEINGGRDQGAVISDAIGVLLKGTCTEQEAGWDAIYPNRIPASAQQTRKRFKASAVYKIDTWEQLITAIQLDFITCLAVMVGNTFMRLDSNGICGYDRGPGNHAVCADGCKKIGGEWVVDMPNTWGTSFGQSGRGMLTQRHFDGVYQDAYAIQATVEDPDDDSNPPEVTP